MKPVFIEEKMVMLIQQAESLKEEFRKLGYDPSDESIQQMKFLIKNNFLNHKAKSALNKLFKKHVENGTGYLVALYNSISIAHNGHEPVDGKRFYVWRIDETNGEYEYTHKGVVELEADENPDEWLEEYTSEFYANGRKEDDYYWFNEEIICENGGITEISKDEFSVVAKYI
jgi:hypothetical protein